MKIKFRRLSPKAVIPVRKTSFSAGMDLCACIDEPVTLEPGDICTIPTGLAAEPDENDAALLIYPRSGLSSRYGISLANCVGVVDSDYRGEIKIPLINNGREPFVIKNEMRIAQLVLTKVIFPEIEEVSELSDTERGSGGFGSTGI
ncbi:MAG: dUTP diphosphatase [Ruminococcus sp.]|nr:dUTP diphosphatase [Ruminococcus sp.]